jgi:hypothetical protein
MSEPRWRYRVDTVYCRVQRVLDGEAVVGGYCTFDRIRHRQGFSRISSFGNAPVAAMYERARDDLLGRGLIDD